MLWLMNRKLARRGSRNSHAKYHKHLSRQRHVCRSQIGKEKSGTEEVPPEVGGKEGGSRRGRKEGRGGVTGEVVTLGRHWHVLQAVFDGPDGDLGTVLEFQFALHVAHMDFDGAVDDT